jgi:hypothetical protein
VCTNPDKRRHKNNPVFLNSPQVKDFDEMQEVIKLSGYRQMAGKNRQKEELKEPKAFCL